MCNLEGEEQGSARGRIHYALLLHMPLFFWDLEPFFNPVLLHQTVKLRNGAVINSGHE
jgi:hypothetical protein